MGKLLDPRAVKLDMKTRAQGRFWNISVATGLFLLLLMALSVYLQLELPEPKGPYAVGRAILRWVDTSRPEVLTDDPIDFREVMAMIWYPAVPDTGRNTEYFPGLSTVADDLVLSGEVAWWQTLGLRWVRTRSYLDAQPLKDQVPFPVILTAPGNGTNIEFYASLAGELASHGYIVVGINHPHDVAAVELSGGHVAPYDKEQWSMDATDHQTYIAERHPIKVADMLFVLDRLDVLNADESNPFVAMLDLESVAAAGHSLGGLVAADACKANVRLKACINFDGIQKGGPFSMEETAIPPSQPFLFLTKESQLHPRFVQRFEDTSESYWITIHGASHASFTDAPLLQPSLLPIRNHADTLMNLIQDYTLAFLDQTLKGQPKTRLLAPGDGEQVSVKVFPSE